MKHCQTCFMLVRTANGICPRCGGGQPAGPRDAGTQGAAGAGRVLKPLVEVREARPPARPRSPAEGRIESALRWTRRVLMGMVGTVCLIVGLRALADMNRAAEASWTAQAQLGAQRYERREALRRALAAMQELYKELRETAAAPPTGDALAAWRQRWRGELASTRNRYRLTGQPSPSGELHPAEEPLRDATLYLTSLEREWGEQGALSASLSASLEQSFERAGRALD